MKIFSLVMSGMYQNDVFNLESKLNRDEIFWPWAMLRHSLLKKNIEINTIDMNLNKHVECEIHLDIWQPIPKHVNAYLVMLEAEQVRPRNSDKSALNHYKKIFTWNDELVDGDRFIKINFPSKISINPIDGVKNRDKLCCLISSNKALRVYDSRDLYSERVREIKWFEKNAPEDFDLYGSDWDLPAWGSGKFGKFMRRIFRVLSHVREMHPFPSYRGKIQKKSDVLIHTRFSICFENVRDLPGYISEKIFDCFFSGCIPVYWGASNITDYIPADCFIDRRQFLDTEALYIHIKKITEEEFIGYQERIATFLQSDAAYQFSSEFFAETIANTIVQDIGI